MRFIPRNCIKPNTVLAKPILGVNGEILLREGVVLKDSYIKRLELYGINGAYIEDDISKDLVIESVITEDLRSKAIRNLVSTFASTADVKVDPKSQAAILMKTAEDIVDEMITSGDVMFNLIDLKSYDSYTFYHSVNVTVLSLIIGIGLEFSRSKLVKLAYSALMHDIGKVFIDINIINKPGSLTAEEFTAVKQHPQSGYEYVKFAQEMTEVIARGVLEHHERFDGGGYPEGKAKNQISEFGRIIAIADVYDALISDRPYRKGLFPVEAMEYILGNCDRQFDYNMVSVFTKKVALFPAGSCVQLSNGAVGLVMENYSEFSQRPLIRVFEHERTPVEPYLLDLSSDHDALNITVVATVMM